MDSKFCSLTRSNESSSKLSSFWQGLLNKNSYRSISQYFLHDSIKSLLFIEISYVNRYELNDKFVEGLIDQRTLTALESVFS